MNTDTENKAPERVWLKLQEISGHQRYMESSDFDNGDIGYVREDLVSSAAAPPGVSDLQRELAFYFGAYHGTLDHRLGAAACMENDCVRVRQLCHAAPPAPSDAPVSDLGTDTNFPLSETLKLMVEWIKHLHDHHNCDCHGWEQRSFLIEAAERYQREIATVHSPSDAAVNEAAHPEDYCHRCGRSNIVWFGPNEVWNKSVRAIDEKEILCPVCFVELAERAGFKGVWEVAPQGFHAEEIERAVVKAMGIINRALDCATPSVSSTARPKIICLCGSTRFMEQFQEANLRETLAGNIVLSVGTNTRSDADLTRANYFADPSIKERLDALHFRKIEMADEVLVLNVGGYVGESTRNEINHATALHKPIRYLESDASVPSTEAGEPCANYVPSLGPFSSCDNCKQPFDAHMTNCVR